jgi:hypothetical protein
VERLRDAAWRRWRDLREPWRTIGVVLFAAAVFVVQAIRR